MTSTVVHASGPHSYSWHISQQQIRKERKRANCTHEHTVTFCRDCKMNLETHRELTGKDYGAKRVRVDSE